jgi:phosphatidylserine decarboxylase
MSYWLLRLLPKNLVSRLAGKLADLRLPSPLLSSFIHFYSRHYHVDLTEMHIPLGKIRSFNEFFTRALKPGARTIDADPLSVVSPVDGQIAEYGRVIGNMLIQTKGIHYSLTDLLGADGASRYADGFFITLYLSPADYHRIHAPISGQVKRFSYFSGNLWPVNAIGVQHVGGLFALNERIVTPLENAAGIVTIVKVGATVVGRITLDYSEVKSNAGWRTHLDLPVVPNRHYRKGDEIGQFQLGSTVILLFEKDRFIPGKLQSGQRIRLGEVLGHLPSST